MMNRKIFGRKILAFLLAVLLAFFQMPAVYSHNHIPPDGTNPAIPTIPVGEGDAEEPSASAASHHDNSGGSGSTHTTLPFDVSALPDYSLPGDFDRDGSVTPADFDYWKAHFSSESDSPFSAMGFVLWRKLEGASLDQDESFLIPNPLPGDFNRSGRVDQADYDFWRANFGPPGFDAGGYIVWRKNFGKTIVPLPGDYNRDGGVDAADYVVWRKTLGTTVPAGAGADGDGNGVIDDADYDVWRSNLGKTLVGEYRIARQDNALDIRNQIPELPGHPVINGVPIPINDLGEAIDAREQFNFDMGNTCNQQLVCGQEWVLQDYITDFKDFLLNDNISETTKNKLRAFLELMEGTNGYMNNETDDEGFYTNQAGFYYQRWLYESYLRYVVTYLQGFDIYDAVITFATTIRMLQIIPPPVFGAVGSGASVSPGNLQNPIIVAQQHTDNAWFLWLEADGQTGSGSGGSAEAPAAEGEVSYPMPSYAPTLAAAISNPSDEDAPIIGTKPRKRGERERHDRPEAKTNQIEFVKRLISQLVTHIEYPKASQLPQAIAANPNSALQTLAFMAEYWEKRFANPAILPVSDSQAQAAQNQTEAREPEARSNAKTKPKNELKTQNLTVIQKYLAQGKQTLTKAQDEAAIPAATGKSQV